MNHHLRFIDWYEKKNKPLNIGNKRNPITDVALILIQLPLTQNIGLDIREFTQLQNIISEIEYTHYPQR